MRRFDPSPFDCPRIDGTRRVRRVAHRSGKPSIRRKIAFKTIDIRFGQSLFFASQVEKMKRTDKYR
jgi:hypothetical protein